MELKKLEFEYDDLEPYMDKETVEIHYTKHHQGYVDKLNQTIENYPELKEKSAEWLLTNLNSLDKSIKQKVINFAGGVYNHDFFWNHLKKDSEVEGEIIIEIKKKFSSFEEFKKEFTDKSLTLFGSGWTWLVLNDNELEIVTTQNQNSPISKGMIPLLSIDVWEHAYYLKYKNKRAEFLENFWDIINWEKVNNNYRNSKK